MGCVERGVGECMGLVWKGVDKCVLGCGEGERRRGDKCRKVCRVGCTIYPPKIKS